MVENYVFDMLIFAPTTSIFGGPIMKFDSDRFSTLLPLSSLHSEPFSVSFEQGAVNLRALPNLFFAPNGWFVWVANEDDATRWQVDGQLHDRHDWVIYVEIKGRCPARQFDQILSTLGWPETSLVFQFKQAAVVLDESELRRWAQ